MYLKLLLKIGTLQVSMSPWDLYQIDDLTSVFQDVKRFLKQPESSITLEKLNRIDTLVEWGQGKIDFEQDFSSKNEEIEQKKNRENQVNNYLVKPINEGMLNGQEPIQHLSESVKPLPGDIPGPFSNNVQTRQIKTRWFLLDLLSVKEEEIKDSPYNQISKCPLESSDLESEYSEDSYIDSGESISKVEKEEITCERKGKKRTFSEAFPKNEIKDTNMYKVLKDFKKRRLEELFFF